MSNIRQLPQLSATFIVCNDDDWYDQIPFTTPSGSGPLDITGINFKSTIQTPAGGTLLVLSTGDGTLMNGGTTGVLTFNVPRYPTAAQPKSTNRLLPGNATLDLLATDSDGKYLQLFKQGGPASVTIIQGQSQ